jgi:hypothetical protein
MRDWSWGSHLSPSEVELQMLEELLDGITVSDAVRANALAMLQADSEARRLLVSRTRDANVEGQHAMMVRRDAGIRALLASAEDGDRFDANAARAQLRRTEEDPPPPPACARR